MYAVDSQPPGPLPMPTKRRPAYYYRDARVAAMPQPKPDNWQPLEPLAVQQFAQQQRFMAQQSMQSEQTARMLQMQQQAIERLERQCEMQSEELAALRRGSASGAAPAAADSETAAAKEQESAVGTPIFPSWVPRVRGYGYLKSKPSNLFTYAVEVSLMRRSTVWEAMCSMGPQPLVQFLKLGMAFAFLDAAWLDTYLGNQFNFFAPHINEFNFYINGASWNSQPLVTFLSGCAACVLLGFVLREEDVETLMTGAPCAL